MPTPVKELVEAILDMSHAARMKRAAEQGYNTGERVYHGTSGDFDVFEATGSNTNARSAQEAIWLSDDPEVAAGYARMAAEDAPVQRLIKQSDQAGYAGNFDEQERLIHLAEELEGSGELVNAGGQNVIPAHIRDKNLLEFDAEGATMSDLDDSQLWKWLQEAREGGYDGLKITEFSDNADWGMYRPATHYALLNPSDIRSVNAAYDPANIGKATLKGSADPRLLAGTAAGTGVAMAGKSFLDDHFAAAKHGEMYAPESETLYELAQAVAKIDTPIGNPLEGVADLLNHLAYYGLDGKNRHSTTQRTDIGETAKRFGFAGLDLL